jgi:hypothetical protein
MVGFKSFAALEFRRSNWCVGFRRGTIHNSGAEVEGFRKRINRLRQIPNWRLRVRFLSGGGYPLPPYFGHQYQNKGLRSIHRRINIKTKDLTWVGGHLFSLSATLAYVYENVVATNFNLIAVHADAWIHA